MSQSALLSRQLGVMESVYSLVHEKLDGALLLSVSIGLSGTVNRELLVKAIKLLFQTHPLLRAVILKQADRYCFECSASFDDIPIVFLERNHVSSWKSLTEKFIDQALEVEKYLWRFCIIFDDKKCDQSFECIINIHHAISDGLSLNHVIDTFLSYYNVLLEGKSPEIIEQSLLPAFDDLVVLDQKDDVCKMPDDYLNKVPSDCAYDKNASVSARTTKNIYVCIEEDLQKNIVAAARRHETTVGAVFGAAMLSAAQDMSKSDLSVNLVTALNLRPFCYSPVNTNALSCGVSFIVTPHQMNNQMDFWALAKEYKTKINEHRLAALRPFIHLKDMDIPALDQIQNIAGLISAGQFQYPFFINNKGLIKQSYCYKNISLRFYYESVSQKIGNIAVSLFLTSVIGQTFLTFAYPSPLLEDKWVASFVKCFVKRLKKHTQKSFLSRLFNATGIR